MKKFISTALLLLAISAQSFSQDFSLDSSRIHAQGNPGDLFLASLLITNNSGNPLTFHLNRIVKNLPPNWNSCFCYPDCIAPWIDTLTFSIPSFGMDSIKPNFGTDSVPGIGHITIVLFLQEGESLSPQDTIYFTGSTLSTDIHDAEEDVGSIFPNPAGDFLEIIFPRFQNSFDITIYNILGKEVLKSKITSQQNSVNVSSLISGIYFLRRDNGTKKFTFVKQ